MLKAVIFDFDGVISNSEPWHWMAFNEVLTDFGIKLTKQQYYKKYLGFTDTELFEQIRKDYNIDIRKNQIAELVVRKAQIFNDLIRHSEHIIDGVKEVLGVLRKNKVCIAICSGASAADIDMMLAGTDIAAFFSVIVSADDVEKGKPDSEGFLLTLEKINALSQDKISVDNCVVIEDSHWGIEAAAKAGMHIVAVTNSYETNELKGAERIVANLKELRIEDLQKLCS